MAESRRTRRTSTKICSFCQSKKEPYFGEYEALGRFLSERERILPRLRSGACAKHQRRISQAIKRARHLALLP